MNEELLRQIPLFESLSKDAREFIARRLKTETFAAGETIVRQGDTGNSLYIITNGLVKVTRREKDGTSLELARLQNGDYFGEMSLLAGQPRSADITTLVDTATLVLFKQDMDDILHEYPSIAVHFSKVLSKRLRDTSYLQLSSKPSISVVSIYSRSVEPLFQTVFAVNLAASFIRELMKRVLLIDVNGHSDDAMQVLRLTQERTAIQQTFSQHNISSESDLSPYIIEHKLGFHLLALGIGAKVQPRLLEKNIRFLLDIIQKDYDYIIINCSKDIHKLVHTALEASELIIYLTSTSNNAIQRCKKDVDLFKQGYGETHELIIGVLQEEQQSILNGILEETLAPHSFFSIPRHTYIIDRFLRTGRPFVYDHPKCDISRSIQRFTRKIGGVRIGLALSSGSARGFAHVGVLKVLEEHDIPIDTLAGSSMGALVGGFYAAGINAKELEDIVLSYQDNKRKVRRTIFDITIPRYGLSKGHRLIKFMRHYLGEKTFDDLHIPFIAVATDIRTGLEVVLHNGLVWKALRASGSVPVMFEPYYHDNRYLIDGGISNPLPTDILIERGMNIIISCTVNSIKAFSKSTIIATSDTAEQSGRHKKYGILDALTRSLGIMASSNTLLKSRLADIDIRPNVASIDWIDFHRGRELMHEGELAAEEAIPSILELVHGRG
ncbi:MAG: cyclic nucleotide-binding domain-containing protein [Candidatus Vecturithrix sp.]|nr:cyclic nucleotide-binding domain-containing protein [Candidatus Vecturithrix sp.]